MQKLIVILLLFVIGLMSCEEESIPADSLKKQQEYYPLAEGKYIDYAYDSLVFDDAGVTKYRYQGYIREKIDSLLKNDGEKQYRLIKYWRRDTTDSWLPTDVETVTVSDQQLIRTEENLPFIRLIFPPNLNARWNGNALFDENITVKISGEPLQMFQGWEYRIVQKDITGKIGNFALDSLLEVQEVSDNASIFSLRYAKQTYARGIGPVKREMKIYDSQRPMPGKPWEEYAEKGFSLVQTMIAHN